MTKKGGVYKNRIVDISNQLVGGFNPFEHMSQHGNLPLNRGKHKKYIWNHQPASYSSGNTVKSLGVWNGLWSRLGSTAMIQDMLRAIASPDPQASQRLKGFPGTAISGKWWHASSYSPSLAFERGKKTRPWHVSSGFAIITWSNSKKLEKPCITQGLATCQFVGLILSCNKVIMVDPVFTPWKTNMDTQNDG